MRERYRLKRLEGGFEFVPIERLADWEAEHVSVERKPIEVKRVKRGTWVFRNGKLVKKTSVSVKPRVHIISDIQPYVNIAVDGRVIGGRRQHRDMLRAHGCIEVGTEKQSLPKPPPDVVDRGLVNDIKRAMGKL